MADLVITAAEVLPGTTCKKAHGTAGATITAGQPLYKDSSDSNHLKLAGAASTAAIATCVGISMHAALDGQPLAYCESGLLTLGATSAVAEGTRLVLSTTAGKLTGDAPITTEYVTTLGVVNGAFQLDVDIDVSGQQVP
jgi:hypothetical protein